MTHRMFAALLTFTVAVGVTVTAAGLQIGHDSSDVPSWSPSPALQVVPVGDNRDLQVELASHHRRDRHSDRDSTQVATGMDTLAAATTPSQGGLSGSLSDRHSFWHHGVTTVAAKVGSPWDGPAGSLIRSDRDSASLAENVATTHWQPTACTSSKIQRRGTSSGATSIQFSSCSTNFKLKTSFSPSGCGGSKHGAARTRRARKLQRSLRVKKPAQPAEAAEAEEASRHASNGMRHYPQIKVKRGSRVVIVGGGPAGVHFGTLLAAKGVASITVLEAESEVGGKTLNVHLENDPVPHAMGAIFFGDFYSLVFKPILRKYCPGNKLLSADPLVKKDSYIIMPGSAGQSDFDTSVGMDFKRYILWKAAVDVGLPASSPRAMVIQRLVSSLLKYIRVHESIFGRYPVGMPPPPRDWSRLDMSGLEFLRANGLSVLEGLMILTYQLNGFGSLEGTPAFYLLWGMHPAVTRNLIKCITTGRPFMLMPSDGLQKIFIDMSQYHERDGSMTVKRGARVTGVTRNLSTGGPIQVTYTDTTTSASTTLQADYLVMAVDFKRYASLIQDLHADESDALSGMAGNLYLTTLFDSDPSVPVDRPVFGWFYRMTPNASAAASAGARLYGQLNEAKLTMGKARRGSDGTVWYGNSTGRQRRMAYQWMEGVTAANMTQWNETLLRDIGRVAGQSNVAVLAQAVWPYATHFNGEALKRGNPWKVLQMQGERNTFWVGSSVAFESTFEVIKYNQRLDRRIVIV